MIPIRIRGWQLLGRTAVRLDLKVIRASRQLPLGRRSILAAQLVRRWRGSLRGAVVMLHVLLGCATVGLTYLIGCRLQVRERGSRVLVCSRGSDLAKAKPTGDDGNAGNFFSRACVVVVVSGIVRG